MSRVLITGCLGAIGSPLFREIERLGHEAWGCDVRHTDRDRYFRGDVVDYRVLASIIERVRPELVYHLAGEFGRLNGEDHYERLWQTNAIGTKNVLRLQERARFRLVFFSSSEIYGDLAEPLDEDLPMHTAIHPLNDYALSKWVNELQILNSAALHHTETVRVRLFNTYGPGEYFSPYRSVVCQFIYKALHDLPYEVYTEHSRSFTYVDDTVAALGAIAGNFCAGEVYNIGASRSHSIRALSDMILSEVGKSDAKVAYERVEHGNAKHKQVVNAKAVRDLGFAETVDLAEGIARTVAWQKRVYGSR